MEKKNGAKNSQGISMEMLVKDIEDILDRFNYKDYWLLESNI